MSNSKDKIQKNEKNTNKEVIKCLKEISNNINNLISVLEQNPNDLNLENFDISNIKIPTLKTEDKNDVILDDDLKEKTLIISLTDKKVVLPFIKKDLEQIMNNSNNNYSNIQDIIDDLYTIPLQYYSNPSFSRFREAFKLVRERERSSLKDAIELGLEVFSYSNLHPSIITACKNLNEFDVYLSCLEYNELEDFHFFNIEYISPPLSDTSSNNILRKIENFLNLNKEMSK